MTFLVGKIVLDVAAGAPNNGRGEDNVARVKALRVGRDLHPYVSAQAFRRWWRDSLPMDEKCSPVTTNGKGQKQQAYTAGRPDLYLDDDFFGYMVAVKGETKKENSSCQRDTVVATGTFVSVVPQAPTKDFGTMTRGIPAGSGSLIHEHEFYSAVLAGDVLLDLPRCGAFETDGTGLRVPLTPSVIKELRAAGAEETVLRGTATLRLSIDERRRRVGVLLRTLAGLRGGAKQSLHYGDRVPTLVLLAPVKGGINPFTRVMTAVNGRAGFSVDVFREELGAWTEELDGPVRLGWAPGFLGDAREKARAELDDLIANGSLVIGHPKSVLADLAQEIESGERNAWFEDPR